MKNWSANTDFRRNVSFQGKTRNLCATIVNYLYFSKIKNTQVLLYAKSTSVNVLVAKKNTPKSTRYRKKLLK